MDVHGQRGDLASRPMVRSGLGVGSVLTMQVSFRTVTHRAHFWVQSLYIFFCR